MQHQSGAQRKTPVPQRKPQGRASAPQQRPDDNRSPQRMTQEERIRRQRQFEERQRQQREEEQPLTLEDIFGDKYKK